ASALLGIVENGVDDSFLRSLLVGGWANDPLLGGRGPQSLDSFPGYGGYATLVPIHGTSFNFGDGDQVTTGASLETDQFFYLGGNGPLAFSFVAPDDTPSPTPAPGALFLVVAGLVAGASRGWSVTRRQSRSGHASAPRR